MVMAVSLVLWLRLFLVPKIALVCFKPGSRELEIELPAKRMRLLLHVAAKLPFRLGGRRVRGDARPHVSSSYTDYGMGMHVTIGCPCDNPDQVRFQ
jgi:hypothetical protein